MLKKKEWRNRISRSQTSGCHQMESASHQVDGIIEVDQVDGIIGVDDADWGNLVEVVKYTFLTTR